MAALAADNSDCWEYAATIAIKRNQIPTALRCIAKFEDLKLRAKFFRDLGREEEAARAELAAAEAASQTSRGLLGGLKSFWSSR
jgi:hypothetical protein